MKIAIPAGSTSQIWQIFIADSSSTTGAGLTGLAFNSGSLTAYYHKDTDTTATAITLATMTVGTFTSSGFAQIDATNMPGWYQFCPPNAALSSGKSCAFLLKGATNMAPLPIEVQLQGVPLDFTNATVPTGQVRALGILDNGTASAVSTTSLTLASLSFGTNALAGRSLWIYNATTGAGQDVTVSSNTNASPSVLSFDTLTISLTGTVQYQLYASPSGSLGLPSPVDVQTIKTQAVVASGTVTFPNATLASTTNITSATGITVSTNSDKTGYALSATQTFNNTGTWTGNISGTVTTATNLTNAPTSGDLTATMKTSVATAVAGLSLGTSNNNYTLVQGLTVALAALGGKASGLNTGAPVFRNLADSANVISATTDANGNRSAVTLNP